MSDYPSINSISSIFLFILYSLSLFISLSVIFSINSNGINTISSKLTLYLNISVFIWIFTKLPYILINIKFGCLFSGILHWYCTFQMLILTYTIVDALNIRMLSQQEDDNMNIHSSKLYQIKYTKLLFIFITPILPIIYPISTNSFGSVYEWCGLDRESNPGKFSRYVFLIISFILQIGVIIKFIFLCLKFKTLPKESYDDMLTKLIRGPGAYATVLVSFTFLEDILIFWQHILTADQDNVSYSVEYSLVVIQGFFGISYGLIYFLLEGKDIQVILFYLFVYFCLFYFCFVLFISRLKDIFKI